MSVKKDSFMRESLIKIIFNLACVAYLLINFFIIHTKNVSADFMSEYAEYEAEAEKILLGIESEWDDVEKALYLHDELILRCTYDIEGTHYTSYDAVVNKTAVCNGYANAYQDLLDRVGIESEIVYSSSVNHQWNIVKIDGQYYHVDLTWDDPVSDKHGKYIAYNCEHTYFLKSENYMKQKQANGQYHGDGSDWLINKKRKYVSGMATSEKYANMFWTNSNSRLVYINGKWISVKSGKININTYNKERVSYSATLLKSVDDNWYLWNSVGNWSRSFVYITKCGDRIIYNTASQVMAIDLNGKEALIYEPNVEEANRGYLYGVNLSEEGLLYYDLRTSPSDSVKEGKLNIDITGHLQTNEQIKWTYIPEKKALYLYGAGQMPKSFPNTPEWNIFSEQIKHIYISDGIQNVPEKISEVSEIFSCCSNLQNVYYAGFYADMKTGETELEGVTCSHKSIIIKDAFGRSCTRVGFEGVRECSECRQIVSVGKVISPSNHTYGTTQRKEGDCITEGRITKQCSDCGIMAVTLLDRGNHIYQYTKLKKATYFKRGLTREKYCKICRKVAKKSQVIAKKKLAAPKVKISISKASKTSNASTASKRNAVITYKKVKDATGIQIRYKKKGGKWKKRNVKSKKSSTAKRGKKKIALKTGEKYTFCIRSYRKKGKKICYSAKRYYKVKIR